MKILFTERNFDPETPIKLQQVGCEVSIPKEEIPNVHEFDRESLLATVKEIQPDILVCGFKFKIDKEVLDLSPIKAIFTRTTGLDHIDTTYAKEKDIEVINLKGEELTEVVAVPQLCLGALIWLMRTTYDIGFELDNKKILIMGSAGRIGNKLAYYLHMMCTTSMTIFFDIKDFENKYNPQADSYLKKQLRDSDIVSLNISSTEENRNFMNLEKFKMMKDGSWFLNSARPWLVEEEAFKWALDNKLAGAWVDFELPFTRPNLITTPHIGGRTIESSIKTEVIVVDKILSYVQNNQSNQKT